MCGFIEAPVFLFSFHTNLLVLGNVNFSQTRRVLTGHIQMLQSRQVTWSSEGFKTEKLSQDVDYLNVQWCRGTVIKNHDHRLF